MTHRIDYTNGGLRARVQIDLNGASLDADANPIGSQWQTLKNVLTHLPGMLQKRGAIIDASNTDDVLTGAQRDALLGVVGYYDGPSRAATGRQPYVAFGMSAGLIIRAVMQYSTSSSSAVATTPGDPLSYPMSKLPTVDDWLVICGRRANSATYSNNPGASRLYGGSLITSDSTGTVTLTSGSAAVTGSGTSWTTALEGCVFYATGGDTYANAYYRVRSVYSTTSLTLDRPFAGSNPGAGLAYSIAGKGAPFYAVVANPFGPAGSEQRFRVACGAWGRLVVAYTQEAGATGTLNDAATVYPMRVRWSGVAGSDDGTGGATGIYAWDTNGYLDLNARFGDIVAIVPSRDAVLVFQNSGLTVLRGSPVFDGAGSLDASETYPGVSINGGFAFESTPQGVFFFDKNVGACVYTGSGVQRIGDARVTRTMLPYAIESVGYYDGKVLFSGTSLAGVFVFDSATRQWSLQVPPTYVRSLIPGRVEYQEDVVGLGAGSGGARIVNLANMFDAPGVAATDWDGSSFVVDIKTGKIGDPLTYLRPERVWVTYRLTDLSTTNPYLTATITTGLPDTIDAGHTYANASTELVETTDVETRVLEIQMDRDPMAQLRVLQANAAGKLEIYAVVIDCAVEGEGASS